ncbi:MAG: hypothetical protein NZZ41_07315 [Candidatus Dojkabacteria bacterium]|nr:hypothetical protein [Candidatus Dojkabacteria bacterium]
MLSKEVITHVYKQKDENIVANLSLYNPPTSSKPIEATIDISLEKPLLKKMNEYKLTIARFRIPLFSIYPSFDLRNLFFQVTFRYNNTNYSQSETITDLIYSISEFVTIVNHIIQNAYSGLGFFSNTPPYIKYHEDRFCFVLPTEIIDNGIYIILSSDLYYYLGGFPAKPSTIIPGQYELYLSQVEYYLSPIYDINNAPVISSTSGLTKYNSYMLQSEFHTGSRFNDIQNVIVTTNIPIRQEMLPQITNNPSNTNLTYISTLGIFSDFVVNISEFGQQYDELIYYPQSQFRWTDLISDGQLDRLSFSFLYQKNDQSIHKIYINPGDSASIKIYFVNKNKLYGFNNYE